MSDDWDDDCCFEIKSDWFKAWANWVWAEFDSSLALLLGTKTLETGRVGRWEGGGGGTNELILRELSKNDWPEGRGLA